MAHRIAIIGQSNAIRTGGFVHQLAQLPNVEMGHLGRIGASPSILLPFFAGDVFLGGHDFLVIDVAVIDQLFLWSDAIDPASIAPYVAYGIHRAHMVGAIPIVLILPHQAAVPARGDRSIPLLHRIYRQVARHNGAFCLDMLPMLSRVRAESEARFEAAYDDANHLAADYSAIVARRLAEIFAMIAADPPQLRRREVALPQYARLPLAGIDDRLKRRQRRNSVFSAHYIDFELGDELAIPTGAFERVHGLLINRATSNGIIEVTGTGRIAKALGTTAERDLGYVAQVLPLIGAVRDAGGMLRLRMAPPGTPPTETSWNAVAQPGTHAEIAELLIEYRPKIFELDEPILAEHHAWLET